MDVFELQILCVQVKRAGNGVVAHLRIRTRHAQALKRVKNEDYLFVLPFLTTHIVKHALCKLTHLCGQRRNGTLQRGKDFFAKAGIVF